MANFFKSYYADLSAKRQAQNAEKVKQDARRDYVNNLQRGQKVKYSNLVNGKGEKVFIHEFYFVEYMKLGNDEIVLLNDNKKQAMQGYGGIYSLSGIII